MRFHRNIAIGAVVAMALSSCHKDENATAQDPAAKDARPLLAADGDSVTYAVGNPGFRGRTTVEVAHEGFATVTFTRADKTDRYEGQLGAEALSRLRTTLARNDPRAFSSARTTAQPDEARIEITLVAGGTTSAHAYWDAEQHQLPALRELVLRFNEIAATISKGEVTY